MDRRRWSFALCACLTFAVAGWLSAAASAAQFTYFGLDSSKASLVNALAARNSFLSTLGRYGTDDLESLAGVPHPSLTLGTTGMTATTTFAQAVNYPLLAVSGNVALLDQGPSTPGGPAFNDTIEFNTPVTAFGSYFSQGGDGPANILTLRLENTLLGTSEDVLVGTLGPNAPFYNVFFFGVTDTEPFNRVTMIESYDYDGILLDDVTAGFTAGLFVPEPSSLAMAITAATAGMLVWRLKKRSRPALAR